MTHLFVYGTLMFPEIVRKLTGKSFEPVPAILNGFKRLQVKNADYPAVIESGESEVNGFLLKGVDEESIDILTIFEGDEYQQQKVTVQIDGELIPAVVFMWKGKLDDLDYNDWDSEEFGKNYLNRYN